MVHRVKQTQSFIKRCIIFMVLYNKRNFHKEFTMKGSIKRNLAVAIIIIFNFVSVSFCHTDETKR